MSTDPRHVPVIVTTDLSPSPTWDEQHDASANAGVPTEVPSTPPSANQHKRTNSLAVPGSPLMLSSSSAISGSPSGTSTAYDPNSQPPSPTFSNLSSSPPKGMLNSESNRDRSPSLAVSIDENLAGSRKASVSSENSKSGNLGLMPAPNQPNNKFPPDDETHTLAPTEADSISNNKAIAEDSKNDKKLSRKDKKKLAAPAPVEDVDVDITGFGIQPRVLDDIMQMRTVKSIDEAGGLDHIIAALHTDTERGLEFNEDGSALPGKDGVIPPSLARRKEVYGKNEISSRPSKSLLRLMWLAFQDKILWILSFAAIVSLALGLYQDLGVPERPRFPCTNPPEGESDCESPAVDWVEGVAIVVAIVIVVLVGSINDWQKERQFKKLNDKKDDRTVKVKRNGREQQINTKDLVVGDIALMEPGEILPVDGLYIRGHNARCDESSATGESDIIRKCTVDQARKEEELAKGGRSVKEGCHLISGGKVVEGVGEYMVISVGARSSHGRIMTVMRSDEQDTTTPLQAKLNKLANLIAILAAASGLILFVALMIRFFVQLGSNPDRSGSEKAQAFIQILIISVTVIVVAVPEGLPLAVTLALSFATKRMTKMALLVRVLSSCETMANATVVCSDKTGTISTGIMSVVAGSIGVRAKFVRRFEEHKDRSNANNIESGEDGRANDSQRVRDDFALDLGHLGKAVKGSLRTLITESIALNSSAFEDVDPVTKKLEFVGNKTEMALLNWIRDLGWGDYRDIRKRYEEEKLVVQAIPFSSERKAMAVVVKLPNGKFRLHVKGASEILAKLSPRHIVVADPTESNDDVGSTEDVQSIEFDEISQRNIDRTIVFYAGQSLRTLAVCYRDFETWPPKGLESKEGEVKFDDLVQDLTLVAITALEDPLRDGVTKAIETCHKAGVQVKMCTGDNILTAKSISKQCGILTDGGIIMEGPFFRKLPAQERVKVIPRLQVLARCSPEDKRMLVMHLREDLGETVGVTGDGTNDAPALKAANVGFAMNITGTEVAKEASDIILMDDNFASIVSAIMWGRCVNDAVRKFLQFQLSVNITAVLVTFVTAVASDEEQSVLTAVQLLWVNLIMDTFAALALATDPATPSMLDRKPDRKNAPLITITMAKMILSQALFQLTAVFVLHFAGHRILNLSSDNPAIRLEQDQELSSLVFNVFVWCSIWNQINCRVLDNRINCFKGFFRNHWFILIFFIMVGGQILIIEFGGNAFQVVRLGWRDWLISIIVGFLSIPLGVLVRQIPDPFLLKLVRKVYPKFDREPDLPTHNEEQAFGAAMNDTLSFLDKVRPGRLRSSSVVMRSRHVKTTEGGSVAPMSTLMMMVPTIVGASIGAPTRPRSVSAASLSDPSAHEPSASTQQLVGSGRQIYRENSPDPESDPGSSYFNDITNSPNISGRNSAEKKETPQS